MYSKIREHISAHRFDWWFWLISAAGLLLRLEYLREFSGEIHFPFALGADVCEYDRRAREVLAGVLFPGEPEIHAPLYSLFLAFWYQIGNFSIALARITQLVLNWGAYVSIAHLFRKSGSKPAVILWFLGLSMFTPVLFFHQAELISESLLAPVLAVFFWLIYGAEKHRKLYVGAGMMLGLALLTHGLMLFFAAGEAGYLLWRRQRRNCLLLAAGIAAAVIPVIAAKSIYYCKLTGIQGNTAYNLWIGNNPDADGGCYLRPGRAWETPLRSFREKARASGVSPARMIGETVVRFYLDDPGQLIVMPVKKLKLLFAFTEPIAGADPEYLIRLTPVQRYGAGAMGAVLLLALTGTFFAIRQKLHSYMHFYLLAGCTAAGLLITVVSGRYRQGMMPGIMLLAALGAYYLGKRVWLVIVPVLIGGAVLIPRIAGGIEENHEAASITGEAHYLAGNYDQAEKLLLIAERGEEHPERYHNLLGAIWEERGNVFAAYVRYTQATRHAPDDPDGFLNLGHLLFYHFPAENREEALELIRQALKRKVALPSAYDMLGQDLAQKGDFSGALEMFETALEYAPDNELYKQKVETCRQLAAGKRVKNASESSNR